MRTPFDDVLSPGEPTELKPSTIAPLIAKTLHGDVSVSGKGTAAVVVIDRADVSETLRHIGSATANMGRLRHRLEVQGDSVVWSILSNDRQAGYLALWGWFK